MHDQIVRLASPLDTIIESPGWLRENSGLIYLLGSSKIYTITISQSLTASSYLNVGIHWKNYWFLHYCSMYNKQFLLLQNICITLKKKKMDKRAVTLCQ